MGETETMIHLIDLVPPPELGLGLAPHHVVQQRGVEEHPRGGAHPASLAFLRAAAPRRPAASAAMANA